MNERTGLYQTARRDVRESDVHCRGDVGGSEVHCRGDVHCRCDVGGSDVNCSVPAQFSEIELYRAVHSVGLLSALCNV